MTVHYTREQRKTAKEKGYGLITISHFDPNEGTVTLQGPAGPKGLKVTKKALMDALGVKEKA